jgi:hypothetical protein
MGNYKEPILNRPILELELTSTFKTVTETLGFQTLSDLLQHHTSQLEDLPDFTILLIHEYITFIEKQGLGHYIDPV